VALLEDPSLEDPLLNPGVREQAQSREKQKYDGVGKD
jgi:hypothetical protein